MFVLFYLRTLLYHGYVVHLAGSVREMAGEALFEVDADLQNLPHMVLQSFTSCNVDMRRALAANIVIIGGGAMFRGLKHRLVQVS